MSRILFALCLFVGTSLGAVAQAVRVGEVPGVWDGDRVLWGRFASVSAPPLLAGDLQLDVPAGASWITWRPFSVSMVWLGWELSGKGWSSTTVAASTASFGFQAQWQGYSFDGQVDPPLAVWTVNRWGPLEFGGGTVQAAAHFRYTTTLSLGDLTVQSWGAFVGMPGWDVAWLEFRSDTNVGLSALLYTPFHFQGEFWGRVLGVWGQQEWNFGAWRAGLGGGAGLLWAPSGAWSVDQQWLNQQSAFPWFNITTAQVIYRFAANPAWGILLRPWVSWEPWPGLSCEVARWLPMVGGWSLQPDTTSAPAVGLPSGDASNASASGPVDPRNLWLAGLEVSISLRW